MFKTILKQGGLTQVQSEILDFLLQKGEFKASEIAKKINRPRGVVYKGLEELIDMELIEKIEPTNKVATFRAEHPSKIEALFIEKEKNAKRQYRAFEEILPDMSSIFNLAMNKPGVKFLEGESGLKKILFDTLKSKTEIYSFSDIESARKHLTDINQEYVTKRKKLGIKKKIIIPDTEHNRLAFSKKTSELTEIRFSKKDFYIFKTGIQIYDNKISYQTLNQDNKIGILIEDKNIYQTQKALFEYIWDTL